MRENMGLFRGKRADNGKWVEGCLQIWNDSSCGIQPDTILEPEYAVSQSTVGEFTGMTDKNGKQIFEGDVVSGLFLYALSINGVCVFKDGAFGLEWERGCAKEFTPFTSMCNVQYEVVGNIHDNPELKGVQNDN